MISKDQYENSLSNPISSASVHDRKNSKAPDNYLYSEEESPLVFEESEDDELSEDESQEEDDSELSDDKVVDDDFGKYSSR